MSQTTETTNSNIRWLKPEQVEAMRDAAHEGRHGPRDDAILTLLYDTGLRRGELSAVDRAMLDLDAGELRIPLTIQKDYPNENTPDPVTFELDRAGDLRTVRTLRAHLGARDDDSPALFPSRKGERMTGKGINDVVQRLAEPAGVEPHVYTGRARRAM
jgi:site-specific recombinase XerD